MHNVVWKNCRWNETIHMEGADGGHILVEGKSVTLDKCSGYVPEDPELERTLIEQKKLKRSTTGNDPNSFPNFPGYH